MEKNPLNRSKIIVNVFYKCILVCLCVRGRKDEREENRSLVDEVQILIYNATDDGLLKPNT